MRCRLWLVRYQRRTSTSTRDPTATIGCGWPCCAMQSKDRYMAEFSRTDRNRIKRKPKRGAYDRETIHQILDEALICHVGFVEKGRPYVIPINFARIGDTIVLHGAKASRLLKHVGSGHAVCVEATLV